VAEAVRVGFRTRHGGEEGVAGAEGNHHVAGCGSAHADQRCRIVAREKRRAAVFCKAVFLDEIGRNPVLDRCCCGRRQELRPEVGSSRGKQIGVPSELGKVEEIHPGTIAEINRHGFSGDHRSDERTHEVDLAGAFVGRWIGFVKAADLRTGEALDGD